MNGTVIGQLELYDKQTLLGGMCKVRCFEVAFAVLAKSSIAKSFIVIDMNRGTVSEPNNKVIALMRFWVNIVLVLLPLT